MAGNNYTIQLSDTSLPNNARNLTVQDGFVDNSQLCINLVGRNASGYGQAMAENFVHMLENFASQSIPPAPSLIGQLWYDKNTGTLNVLDSDWKPVGGLYRADIAPTSPNDGDIWVDTSKKQVYFYNTAGQNWVLLGPNYSGGTKTGLYAITINDIYGDPHNIIINYIDDNPMEVIAKETFVPVNVIDGFRQVNAGVNITSKNLGTFQAPVYAMFNGVASSAKNLIQTGETSPISADVFARINKDPNFGTQVTFATDQGIAIGSVPTFNLLKSRDSEATFLNSYQLGQGSFSFVTLNSGVRKRLLDIQGKVNSTQAIVTVGVPANVSTNDPGFPVDLTITGSIKSTGTNNTIEFFSPVQIKSNLSNTSSLTAQALSVVGGVGIAGTLVTQGEHILSGGLKIGGSIIPEVAYATVGTSSSPWGTVYAGTFNGTNFTGTANKASQLVSTFSINFDDSLPFKTEIAYNTGAGAATQSTNGTTSPNLKLQVTPSFVYNKATTSTTTLTDLSDQLVVYRPQAIPEPSGGNGILYKQTKNEFLKNYMPQNDKTGCVMPWATTPTFLPDGITCNNTPVGWLLCNGKGISASAYPDLFSAIQYQFSPVGVNAGDIFNLPDLRQALGNSTPVNRTGGYLNYIIKT
jgi:hypothetical protein